MFSKVFKFFVLLALGTLLASCPALEIRVAFDTAGPKPLSDQDEMILGNTQYGIRFDEPIKLSNPQNASITMTVNPANGPGGLGPFDLNKGTVKVGETDSARLIITIPDDYEQEQAGDTITFAIPENYLTDEADNPNAANTVTTVASMPPVTTELGEMLVPRKVIPNAADIEAMNNPFIASVIFGYAGDTVKEVVYVTVDGTGNGTSWADAAGANELKTKLNSLTDPGEAHVSFLLVGDGTYPANALKMKNRVAIIGGWMANGDWRHDFENDPRTIFSGDKRNRVFDNTYSSSELLTETALLHSVTVQDGGPSDVNGGGMYNNYSSPTLIGVTFSGNDAGSGNGGGMYNNYSSPTLMGVTFSGNNAAGSGGGMYNNYSGPTLVDVTFSVNRATNGGGMYNDNSLPTLKKVTFSANQATNGGGGMYNYAASAPTLSNVTFSANQATNGGGMYNHSDSAPTLINVTFWGNTAGVAGGGMFNANSGGTGPALINSLFWENRGGTNSVTQDQQIYMEGNGDMIIYNSIVQYGINTSSRNVSDGVGWANNASGRIQSHSIIAADPHLETGLGRNDGFIQTHALRSSSPAIDAGLYVRSAFDTASNTMTWYYSNDESTWFTDPADQTNTANPPGEAMDMTATDARDFSRDRPDIGAYEYIATRYSSP